MGPFESTEDSNQLSLNVGEEVLVRQVAAHGWAFGHVLSDRRQGWFPTCHGETREKRER